MNSSQTNPVSLFHILLLAIVTLVLGGAIGFFLGYDLGTISAQKGTISSFEACKAAGYPIMETYPEQCATPEGKVFVRELSEEEKDMHEQEEESPAPKDEDVPYRPLPVEPVACPMDAKICPDGSGVGRTGPNCEFAPCPGE